MLASILAAAVSGAFALVVHRQYRRRGRPHQQAWAIGLLFFSLGNAAAVAARLDGATADEYRLFYVFGAILTVAWLALGTLYVTAPLRVAHAGMLFVYALSVVAVLAVFTSPVDVTAAADTGRGFEKAPVPRILAGIGSGLGSIVLIGGALWSGWRFLRLRHDARRALANTIIAVGAMIPAAGGVAAFTGASGVVEWTNLLGASVMFAGFRLAA